MAEFADPDWTAKGQGALAQAENFYGQICQRFSAVRIILDRGEETRVFVEGALNAGRLKWFFRLFENARKQFGAEDGYFAFV